MSKSMLPSVILNEDDDDELCISTSFVEDHSRHLVAVDIELATLTVMPRY